MFEKNRWDNLVICLDLGVWGTNGPKARVAPSSCTGAHCVTQVAELLHRDYDMNGALRTQTGSMSQPHKRSASIPSLHDPDFYPKTT